MEIEEIKRNIEMENNSDIDINQSIRDTDGDRRIEMDVAAAVDRIIDRRAEKDDPDKNTKKISGKNEKLNEFRSV